LSRSIFKKYIEGLSGMKQNKALFNTGLLVCTFIVNLAWADNAAPGKKLLKPISVQAGVTSNSAGADVGLNSQTLSPADAASSQTKLKPVDGLKPVNGLPQTSKAGLMPLAPIGPTNSSVVLPLGGDAANNRLDACLGKACIISVNGRNVGNTSFKPGTRYQIVGKRFGNARGDVVLNIDGDTAVKLDVTAWRDEEIIAYFKNDFGGKSDSDNVVLFIDVPNTPRITTMNSQRAKFEALRSIQVINFASIPQKSMVYDKIPGGEFQVSRTGYCDALDDKDNDDINHGFVDKITLDFLKAGFKAAGNVLDANWGVGLTERQGKISYRSGGGSKVGSGWIKAYGDDGYGLNGNQILVKRKMWQTHIDHGVTEAHHNFHQSCVDDLKIYVEGPKGINAVK
jgi:hypothetical protein